MDGLEQMVRARKDDDPHDVGFVGKVQVSVHEARQKPIERAMASALEQPASRDPGKTLAETAISVAAEAGIDVLTAFRSVASEPAFAPVVRKFISAMEKKNAQTT